MAVALAAGPDVLPGWLLARIEASSKPPQKPIRSGMSFFGNQDINKLALHTALHQAAMGLSLAFFAAFLLHAGLSPSGVFLTLAAILTLRFFVRAAVLPSVRLIGFRNTFLLGALLFAVEYLVLAAYDGSNVRLLWFIVSDAVCSAFYWTCYHAFYAALGDPEARGAQ